ncbi:hypothetical protein [Sodalis sp. C49]|uniref:hypothetical protein n=1 Tax=Sodalis sp. C49 TaxID=3228929 RepID=UPI00396590A0
MVSLWRLTTSRAAPVASGLTGEVMVSIFYAPGECRRLRLRTRRTQQQGSLQTHSKPQNTRLATLSRGAGAGFGI